VCRRRVWGKALHLLNLPLHKYYSDHAVTLSTSFFQPPFLLLNASTMGLLINTLGFFFLFACKDAQFVCHNQTVELVKQKINQLCVTCSQDQYPTEINWSLTDTGPKWLGLLFQKTLPQFLSTGMLWCRLLTYFQGSMLLCC